MEKICYERGDVKALVEITGHSKPTVIAALKWRSHTAIADYIRATARERDIPCIQIKNK